MYASYWKLREKPFENRSDPRFYYPAESHQAALLKLRYAIENCRGGTVLAGPCGSGKTLLVEMLRTMLGPLFTPVTHLVFPQMTGAEMLGYLAGEWSGGGETPGTAPVHQSVQRIERFLAENTQRGQRAVVVVDEAHLLDEGSALETLRLLLNFRGGGEPGLTLLLAGQPGILPILDRAPQLEERLAVKCLLRPLTERETAEYVNHRLKQAGAAEEIFEPAALAALYRLTHGIPRRINRLGDLALLIGYAEELRSVAADQVEAVHQELVTVMPE